MDTNVKEKLDLWLSDDYYDQETKSELLSIQYDSEEVFDRFYKKLDFGTGGMRGLIGAGTNRMNIYTIREASQGLADYVLSQNKGNRGIVISYDSRLKSDAFAHEAANVFIGNGIKVYMFDALRPVPELSFAVRTLNAAAGVMITASHNPKTYNGYKIYGEDGGQMPLEWTNAVLGYINKITDHSMIRLADANSAPKLIEIIGQNIDQLYISNIKALNLNLGLPKEKNFDIKIVYTPLHGAGNVLVRRVLGEIGFRDVMVVKEQELPDSSFSTVKVPNPEEVEAFELAIKLAKSNGADLIIATDPDCDRIGVAVKNSSMEYSLLTGNEIGCLLMEFLLSQMQQNVAIPANGFVVKSIVSSELAIDIASRYDVEMVEVLTGFKFIGEKIKELDEFGDKKYIFGFEESYGYLAGTFVRDKDAVISAMLITEMAAFYKAKNMSLYDALSALHKKYRYAYEKVFSHTLTGKDGMDKMKTFMQTLRNHNKHELEAFNIVAIRDYLSGYRFEVANSSRTPLQLPTADVLYCELDHGNWLCIRPSGTEPKLKIYYGVYDKTPDGALNASSSMEKNISAMVASLLSN